MNRLIIFTLILGLTTQAKAAQEQPNNPSSEFSCCYNENGETWNGMDEVDLSDLEDEALLLEALENHKPTCWQSTQACCAACWALCKIKATDFGDHLKEHKTAYGIVGTAACIGILAYFIHTRIS